MHVLRYRATCGLDMLATYQKRNARTGCLVLSVQAHRYCVTSQVPSEAVRLEDSGSGLS
jgi:hypothetical protein